MNHSSLAHVPEVEWLLRSRLYLRQHGCGYWDSNHNLLLVTPDVYKKLPLGTILRSITNKVHTVGIDEPGSEYDTRIGCLPVGFPSEELHD